MHELTAQFLSYVERALRSIYADSWLGFLFLV